ncbi:dihydrolipoyllysine-residue acetyltransferase [Candidatus Spongiihabitans sp.]|uniref:dihydrolipoyllysine-residue acetyltransferase n=1 Tax=Candidatus Spongiihabitans sp. TaxID=3101308 RepID=UPI003C7D9148
MAEVKVPDIGDFDAVEIIEILVNIGDTVAAEDPLLTLESDKATMDIPAPGKGTITAISVAVGDSVSEGMVIMHIDTVGDTVGEVADPALQKQEAQKPAEKEVQTADIKQPANAVVETLVTQVHSPAHSPASISPAAMEKSDGALHSNRLHSNPPHASPGVRRFARELGADLGQIGGSGPKARILKQDVIAWVKSCVKQKLSSPTPASETTGAGIPPIPEVDFSQFGEIETIKLSRIKKLSGPHLQRAWLNIPHVTHHDEADITELEQFRKSLKNEAEKDGIRITLLSFVMKAMVGALKKYPNVNASLAVNGEELILKKYYNIGIAVDTPNGLVVPVVQDVDRKSVFDLAREMADISQRSRAGKLKPDDLKGGCISISSLGGIGGSAFTPIVNAPEVAILGVSRAKMMPLWNGESFDPRLILPLDLSYDHRVIDGAEAARFVAYLTQSFGDVRRLSL